MKSNDCKNHLIFLYGSLAGMFFILLWGCKPSTQPLSDPPSSLEINIQAISFLGDTLRSPEVDEETFYIADSLLQEAFTFFTEDSTDLNAIIWYGRRLAYMHRYRDAVTIFSRGIVHHPDAPELYRHRGHRYITMRQTDLAIDDLVRAASLMENREIETEADGIPNKLNMPLGNLHFNIYYHLGLAYYLKADYQKAISAFITCQSYSNNPDLIVATLHWLYLSYLKSGDKTKADELLKPISPDMEIIENGDYLQSLLTFKQENSSSSTWQSSSNHEVNAAHLYGFTCWLEVLNQPTKASALRSDILSDERWFTLGYIAAEADSSRLLLQ